MYRIDQVIRKVAQSYFTGCPDCAGADKLGLDSPTKMSGMIRVANIIEEGRFGGPQARIVLVAEALKKYGIETHVVYSKYDSDKLSQKLSRAGISNSAINITRLTREKKVLARYLICFFAEVIRLYLLFRREKFDLVHVNGSYQFKGALAATMAGIPVIWHLNDTSIMPIVKKMCIFIAKYCASGFIVAGQRVYNYYIRGTALDRKLSIEIHAPVDTTVFDPKCVVPDKRLDKYDGIKIVSVSNVNPTKGLECFIETASSLTQRYKNLHFFVGGAVLSSQVKYYHTLKKLVASKNLSSDNFTFLGRVDNVPTVLKSADICIFTSLAEASPTAVWEAMSMGKAIASTDVGSVRQYIEDGKSGFIVPIKDSKALSKKVEILAKDPLLRQKMGSEARAVAKKRLDVSIAAEKHAIFYRKILGLQKDISPQG